MTAAPKGYRMYRKILVPLDGSKLAEQILPFARSLAQATQSSVELLRVNDAERITAYAPPLQGGEYLDEVAKKYFSPATRVDQTVELGTPAIVIVDRAAGDPACLIAMATHGMSGIRRWLIGSVASKVLQTTANPVLLLRPTGGAEPVASFEPRTIFVPLDGSGLAEKALAHAVALAKRMKPELHLVRVYTLPANAYIVADGVIAQGTQQFREAMSKEAEDYLDGRVQELRGDGLDRVIATALEGDPASEIIDLATKTENSLIVMSTHGRSGIGRWALGSVAEKVVQHSRAPVLLLRAG
jgi:nucleotide-binding universal stress UspA family protein